MRDKLKNEAYWVAYMSVCDELISRANNRLQDPAFEPQRRMDMAGSLRDYSFQKFCAAYSAGWTVEDLQALFMDSVDGLSVFVDEAKRHLTKDSIHEYFFAYDKRTRYLALAILFNADQQTVARLVEAIDFWPGKDAIWEKMIAHLGVQGRPPVDSVQWPEAYDNLWKCFSCAEEQRPAQLKLFADRWYKRMGQGDKVWVNSHKNKHDVYFGYWCFEAAGVAKMLGIDDQALKDHPNYPFDLVHG